MPKAWAQAKSWVAMLQLHIYITGVCIKTILLKYNKLNPTSKQFKLCYIKNHCILHCIVGLDQIIGTIMCVPVQGIYQICIPVVFFDLPICTCSHCDLFLLDDVTLCKCSLACVHNICPCEVLKPFMLVKTIASVLAYNKFRTFHAYEALYRLYRAGKYSR